MLLLPLLPGADPLRATTVFHMEHTVTLPFRTFPSACLPACLAAQPPRPSGPPRGHNATIHTK